MKLRSLVRRRPSPAMAISLVALFMSLGGVGYAATQLPNNSVGAAQLRNGAVTNSKLKDSSVTFKKIEPGSVGTVRANTNQLQARVKGTCSSGQGIGAIDSTGKVTCNTALPSEFGTTNNSATIATAATATPVTSVNLPAGPSYLAFANPTATVTSTGTSQRVNVSCTLTVGSNTQTRSATVTTTGTAADNTSESIPMQVAGPAGTASVSCQATPLTGTLPTTTVTAAINALQTASNS